MKPPPEATAADRRVRDRRRETTQQENLDDADRRHKERRQYAEEPSGWTPLVPPLPGDDE